MATANMNIRTDPDVKKQAQSIFADLGLDMSTAVNMFLRQTIIHQGLPFDVKLEKPNDETVAAMQEADKLSRDPNTKRYSSFSELLAEVNADV